MNQILVSEKLYVTPEKTIGGIANTEQRIKVIQHAFFVFSLVK